MGSVKHNLSNTRLYHIWRGMLDRCYNEKNHSYHRYGGRGITCTSEWSNKEVGFQTFYDWAMSNGYQEDLTIDRINNNLGYSPDNCRWADAYTQANNKSSNIYVTREGRTQTLKQWTDELGIDYHVVQHRLGLGWSMEDALTKDKRFDGIETLTYQGRTQTIMEWAVETGMTYNTIKHRVRAGLPVDKILETPQKEHDVSPTYYKGEYHSLREWAKIFNIKFTTLSYRLNTLHMSIEEALETPVDRRNQDIYEYKGATKTLRAWAKEYGFTYACLAYRVHTKGMSIGEALETPSNRKKGNSEC